MLAQQQACILMLLTVTLRGGGPWQACILSLQLFHKVMLSVQGDQKRQHW